MVENELIKEYLEIIEHGKFRNEPLTDAPEIYHIFNFLTVIGALLKDNIHLQFSNLKIYPNLWMVLIGRSSLYRKSTAIKLAIDIVSKTNKKLLLPSEFSLEKLFSVLSEQNTGVFWIDEFSNFFSQFHRTYMQGGLSFFVELYDKAYLKRSIMDEERVIENPCISILSATTIEGISIALKEREIRTGLLPRFVFVYANKKEKEVYVPDAIDWEKYNALLGKIKAITEKVYGSQKITKEAIDYFTDYQKAKTREVEVESPDFLAFLTRIYISILKISLILSAIENKVIDGDVMEKSCDLGNYIIYSAKEVFENLVWSPLQERKKKVFEYLTHRKGWITRSETLRYTRLSSGELDTAIETLIDEDRIIQKTERHDGGKPTIYYKVKEEGDVL